MASMARGTGDIFAQGLLSIEFSTALVIFFIIKFLTAARIEAIGQVYVLLV